MISVATIVEFQFAIILNFDCWLAIAITYYTYVQVVSCAMAVASFIKRSCTVVWFDVCPLAAGGLKEQRLSNSY